MTSSPDRAERNARVLESFILQGEAMAAALMAEAQRRLKSDPEAVGKLVDVWNRVTRRTAQAMLLERRLEKAEAARDAETPDVAPAARDPQHQRRKDLLREFRMSAEGLDAEGEDALRELLDDMAGDDELADYSFDENLTRIVRTLDLKHPSPAAGERPRPLTPDEIDALAPHGARLDDHDTS